MNYGPMWTLVLIIHTLTITQYCDQQCDQCEFVFGNDSAAAGGTTFTDVEQSVSRQ